jgi:hypothetical protein
VAPTSVNTITTMSAAHDAGRDLLANAGYGVFCLVERPAATHVGNGLCVRSAVRGVQALQGAGDLQVPFEVRVCYVDVLLMGLLRSDWEAAHA